MSRHPAARRLEAPARPEPPARPRGRVDALVRPEPPARPRGRVDAPVRPEPPARPRGRVDAPVRPEPPARPRGRVERRSPILLSLALAVATLAPLAHAPPAAHAQPAAARVRTLLDAGERFFAEQEYGKAIRVLLPVTRDAAATRAQRVRAWELIALSRYILRDLGGARDAFERVLEADPGFQLRDTSGSPTIRAFFDELRAEVLGAATALVDLEHAAPRAGTAGTRLELEIRATRGAASVTEVVVLHREVGVLAYDTAPARALADGRWRATLRLPPSRRPSTREYYVEARGVGGSVLARIAAPDAPLALEISPGSDDARPWYGRWYVIAGAAALAAGATGAVILATGGPDDGTLPPGRVTVTP